MAWFSRHVGNGMNISCVDCYLDISRIMKTRLQLDAICLKDLLKDSQTLYKQLELKVFLDNWNKLTVSTKKNQVFSIPLRLRSAVYLLISSCVFQKRFMTSGVGVEAIYLLRWKHCCLQGGKAEGLVLNIPVSSCPV